jgi:hypothetical protein
VDETEFPATGTEAEQLRFLLRYAVLAPSSHNSQPWSFRLENGGVALFADRRRRLPVVDPDDRALVISCGAALYHLRLAMTHFGRRPSVALLPAGGHPDLLAMVSPGGPARPTPQEREMFRAIPRRHTNRRPFRRLGVPRSVLDELQATAAREGAWLHVVDGEPARHAVADLVAEGDRIQTSDPAFRRELAAWMRPNDSDLPDGIPGYAFGFGDLMAAVGPFVVRTFDMGRGIAARDRDLATGSPVLAVLGTDADDAGAWLAAGQALAAVLLLARSEEVWASFLNQPIEVPLLRPRLRDLLGRRGHPQLLLRMGYGNPVEPTPRRDVGDVVVG